jgi:hypothetical protein
MVMVEIDSNAILDEPMKSRKDEEMIRAYNALLLRLKQAGSIPEKHVLDNEVSENMKNHIRDTCKFDIELVPPGCHQRNAAKVAIHNFEAHFHSVLAGVANDFPQAYGIGIYRKPRSRSTSSDNLMPPQMCQHMLTSADRSTTTKCRLPQWDVRPRCMRQLTHVAHGHIIWWMDGICSCHTNIIVHITATSSTPRANDYPTWFNSNTSASPIPPSPTPTK